VLKWHERIPESQVQASSASFSSSSAGIVILSCKLLYKQCQQKRKNDKSVERYITYVLQLYSQFNSK
jgi:hypothetical protein